ASARSPRCRRRSASCSRRRRRSSRAPCCASTAPRRPRASPRRCRRCCRARPRTPRAARAPGRCSRTSAPSRGTASTAPGRAGCSRPSRRMGAAPRGAARTLRERRPTRGPGAAGLHYDPAFVSPDERDALVRWLEKLRPIWENRFTDRHAAATGVQRQLLRPVYWLGSWQFACLDYYRPPAGVHDRAVRAEPFPPVLARLVRRIEALTRAMFRPPDLPPRWRLNTCLINLYGSVLRDGKAVDT